LRLKFLDKSISINLLKLKLMDEFIGIIKIFAGNFAPRGWAICNGQLMSISQNTALFSILGTTYGGDGQTTFALPDLKGRVPVGQGTGPGLQTVDLGEVSGEQNHTLIQTEIPAHTHAALVSSADSTQAAATNGASIATPGSLAGRSFVSTLGFNTTPPNTALNPTSITPTGGSQPHNNMQPYLGINYIICTDGLYPSRS
jgi:microcystin-dependent protein